MPTSKRKGTTTHETTSTHYSGAASRCVTCNYHRLATSGAWAATDKNWTGGSGGTEAAPLEFYNADNWESGALPSSSYNMVFPAGTQVVLTNNYADAATSQVVNDIKTKGGSYTFLGSYIFQTFQAPPSGAAGTISVVKKGDWKLMYAAYFGRESGSYCAFTNVSGKIEHTANSRWFEIGVSGTCIAENLSGDWSVAGNFSIANDKNSRGELYWRGGNLVNTVNNNSNPFWVGRGETSTSLVEKDAGNWRIDNYLVIANGKNSTASFKNNGGNLTVNGTDIRLGDNSASTTGSAYLEIGGGTVEGGQACETRPWLRPCDAEVQRRYVQGTCRRDNNLEQQLPRRQRHVQRRHD